MSWRTPTETEVVDVKLRAKRDALMNEVRQLHALPPTKTGAEKTAEITLLEKKAEELNAEIQKRTEMREKAEADTIARHEREKQALAEQLDKTGIYDVEQLEKTRDSTNYTINTLNTNEENLNCEDEAIIEVLELAKTCKQKEAKNEALSDAEITASLIVQKVDKVLRYGQYDDAVTNNYDDVKKTATTKEEGRALQFCLKYESTLKNGVKQYGVVYQSSYQTYNSNKVAYELTKSDVRNKVFMLGTRLVGYYCIMGGYGNYEKVFGIATTMPEYRAGKESRQRLCIGSEKFSSFLAEGKVMSQSTIKKVVGNINAQQLNSLTQDDIQRAQNQHYQ